MKFTSVLLAVGCTVTAASFAASNDLAPSNAPFVGLNGFGTRSEIAEPISVMSLVPVTDSPPPFGTVMQSWQLNLSGSYAGAGITWRRDSARFYLMDMGYSGPSGLWSCTAEDPRGTTRRENCVMPNLGSSTTDNPWGIAWDNDSSCFWITNILDGSVYSGCYLVKLTLGAGDTWRLAEPVQAQDTWRIDGVMDCYWLAGMEKWSDRDYFCGTPVATGGSLNNTVKFDPYTKTFIGRLPNGTPPYSERGCALVPWDSCYILTCGWNANSGLLKHDSTGAIIDSAFFRGGAADIALYVPQTIEPDDTVFLYDICSDPNNTMEKVSVGMLWSQLPSANPFNVRPVAVLAPSGAVDSGRTVTPSLVIRNTCNEPALGVSVWFTIDAGGVTVYSDSIIYFDMPERTTETLACTDWIPQGRDTMSVTAWTFWQGDSCPQDDTIRNRFLVRVRDIAVTDITMPAPDTVIDSGAVFRPECRVWNHGNVPLMFDVRFRIGTYQATRTIRVIPSGATLVSAPANYTALPCIQTCQCFAVVVDDLHPEDNIRVDTFTVRGTIARDAAARALLAPTGVVDTGQTVTPRGRFGNNGVDIASFWTFFSIQDSGGTEVYAESAQAVLNPGDTTDIEYPAVRFTVMGNYTAVCSVAMTDDQNSLNDQVVDTFEVAPVGVADGSFIVPRLSFTVTPNPVTSGFVLLSFTGPLEARPESLDKRPVLW